MPVALHRDSSCHRIGTATRHNPSKVMLIPRTEGLDDAALGVRMSRRRIAAAPHRKRLDIGIRRGIGRRQWRRRWRRRRRCGCCWAKRCSCRWRRHRGRRRWRRCWHRRRVWHIWPDAATRKERLQVRAALHRENTYVSRAHLIITAAFGPSLVFPRHRCLRIAAPLAAVSAITAALLVCIRSGRCGARSCTTCGCPSVSTCSACRTSSFGLGRCSLALWNRSWSVPFASSHRLAIEK